MLSIYSWLKANLVPNCSLPLPGSFSLLPLSTGILLLCIIINVMLHREVATCFLMNWVSVLFEWLLFPLLQDFPWNWFLFQLISHAGSQISYDSASFLIKSSHPSDYFFVVDLEPPDPMVSIHIRWVSSMTFTLMMWVVFSLIHQTRVTHYMASGGTQSNLLTTWSPSDILLVLAQDLPSDGIGDFRTVLCFPVTERLGDFLHWGGCPVIHD